MNGIWVLVVAIGTALFIGLLWFNRNGRIRHTAARRRNLGRSTAPQPRDDLPAPVAAALPTEPGTVTLMQFSTTFCAPCRHARAVLGHLAGKTDGLRYVDLDVTDQPQVARAVGVLRTPTTIAFTASGQELLRVSGVPKADQLLAALRADLVPQNERGFDPGSA